MILPLLKGLKLTLKFFFSKPVTVRYPEQKRPVAPRWRGMHYFEMNEKGEPLCVACGLCVAVCPSHCITLEIREREDGTRYPEKYEINAARCVYCGFCQEACPVNAIKLGQDYEYVKYARDDFKLTKDVLLSAKRTV
jgi:NADH-quinone oxidoreductase subunit I